MSGMMRQAFRVRVLALLCICFLLLSFGWNFGQTFTFMDDPAKQLRAGISLDIAQGEQPTDYAVRPNSPYPRPNSPLTLKQIQHFLAIALSLILLVLIGSYAVYPTRLNSSCIFVSSWHLLRAPPKTI